jgi:hypothetical protein
MLLCNSAGRASQPAVTPTRLRPSPRRFDPKIEEERKAAKNAKALLGGLRLAAIDLAQNPREHGGESTSTPAGSAARASYQSGLARHTEPGAQFTGSRLRTGGARLFGGSKKKDGTNESTLPVIRAATVPPPAAFQLDLATSSQKARPGLFLRGWSSRPPWRAFKPRLISRDYRRRRDSGTGNFNRVSHCAGALARE